MYISQFVTMSLILMMLVPPNLGRANSSETTKLPRFNLPFFGDLGTSSFEPLVKSMTDQVKLQEVKNPAVKSFFEMLAPKTTTTTTTTTSPSPMEALTKTIADIPGNLPNSKLLESPAKVINNMITNSLDFGQLSETSDLGLTANKLMKVTTDTAGQVIGRLSKAALIGRPEDESVYYEYEGERPYEHRRPKYFSRECQFRVACEVGKLLKPISSPLHTVVETNKVVQDLQNRYTRAMTYGMLHADCERYYCLFVQLLGGPGPFASGVAEMLNRVANPEMYAR